MKSTLTLSACLLSLSLSGCLTPTSQTEEILPVMQQNTYLSHTKPPQQFGFNVFPVKDGISFQGSARLHPRHFANKFFAKGHLPVVEMQGLAARSKMNVLLDLSTPHSWLEFTTSQKLNATFMGIDDLSIPYRGAYNTGNVPAYASVIRQIRMDQLFMENVPFYTRMAMNSLGPLARGIKTPQIDAVMGYDNLQAFEYVQIDMESQRVQFSASQPYVADEDRVMTKTNIVKLRNYGLAVEGAVFGEATPILLDFAGDYHFARGQVKVNTTRQVSIGDIVYRDVPTLLLPIHNSPPRAGRKMLDKYIITICNKQGIVYFERPE